LAGLLEASGCNDENVAVVPLAMPIIFGPGAITTILGMTSTVKHTEFELASFVAICVAIVVTMYITALAFFVPPLCCK
jgi:multiple antibiotic resistance protein